MPSRTRTVAAVLGALTLTVAGCSSQALDKFDHPTESASATTASTSDEPSVLTPVIASVVAAPVPVPATDGKIHLAYELQVTNTLPQEVTLNSLAVRSAGQTLLELPRDQLEKWTRVVGTTTPTTKLGPGQAGMIWLDVTYDKSATAPRDLEHALSISIPQPSPPLIPAELTEPLAPVAVQSRKPAVVSPPLRGANWLDGDSCCELGGHRTAMNPINGQIWAAERFAIDYVQLAADGTMFKGDVSNLDSFPYFGTDIHAVADGPVVAVTDDLPEQVPGKSPTGLTLAQYGGNHIVQDIGDGNYAFYAHLETGSVKVKPGDQLSTGQIIANLGNTGNSDAPHLHFHVMSGPDPLRANGLPFVFSSFRLDSRVASAAGLDALMRGAPAPMQPGFTPRDETDVSPLMLDNMSYDNP